MWASLVAQTVKHLPGMQEAWVQSLGWEDLEKEMAIHSSTRCLENSMDEGVWQAAVHGIAKTEQLHWFTGMWRFGVIFQFKKMTQSQTET